MPSGPCQCDSFASHVTFAAGASIKTQTAGGYPLFVWSNGDQDSRPLLRLGSEYGGVFPRLDIRLENTPATRPTILFATDREGSSATPPHLTFQTAVDGRVGIGTLEPVAKLDVRGTLAIGSSTQQLVPDVGVNDQNDKRTLRFLNGASASLTEGFQFYNAALGTSLVMIQQAGRVGINTKQPEVPLQISDANTPGNDARMRFIARSGDGSTTHRWDIGAAHGTASRNFVIHDASNMAAPALVVQSPTGNVGIGTTGPDAKLTVARTAAAGGLEGPVLQLRADGGQSPRLTVDVANVTSGTPVYRLVLGGNAGVQPNLGLAVGGGRVGIGTETPNSVLQVQNHSGAGLLTLRAGDGPEPRLNVDVVNTPLAQPTFRLQADSNQADPTLKPHLALAPVAGNVGVGTTDPDMKLAVVNVNGVGLFSVRATQGKAPRLNVGMVNTPNDQPTILVRAESEMAQPPDKPRLVFTAGRVGIGTTDDVPDSTLGVSNADGHGLLQLMAFGTPRPRLTIEHWLSTDPVPKGQFYIGTADANSQYPSLVLLHEGGNVGIGTATVAPTERLEVGGNIKASGKITAGNDLKLDDGSITIGSKKVADGGGCFYA